MLQCVVVVVCCSALQCVAVCCSVLQCVAVCCSVLSALSLLLCVAVCCMYHSLSALILGPVIVENAVCDSAVAVLLQVGLQCVAACCSVLQCIACITHTVSLLLAL